MSAKSINVRDNAWHINPYVFTSAIFMDRMYNYLCQYDTYFLSIYLYL